MIGKDSEGNLGVFNFDGTTPDRLVVRVFLPELNYRGFFSFDDYLDETVSSVVTVRTNSARRSPLPGGGRALEAPIVSPGQTTRRMQSTPGFVNIFVTECLQNVDPTTLDVTAVADGSETPVAVTKASTGSFRASLSVQDSEVSEDVIDAVCSALSTAAMACPFVLGKMTICIHDYTFRKSF